MPVTIKPASTYKALNSHKFMKSMASGGLARFLLLEGFVESGRTYQAYKRGGFDEGRERITEEFTAAVFWLGGIKSFNALNDKIGKRVLGMRTASFDLGHDKSRDSLANFLHTEVSKKTKMPFTENQLARFKAAKLITSIIMANSMIGFVVPKLNQAITRYYHRNDVSNIPGTQNVPEQAQMPLVQRVSMDKFLEDKEPKKKDISFGAGSSPLLSLAFNLENNTTWQLLSTDVGTVGGRTISARNNNERREILLRDLTSLYFYMFNMPCMNRWMNMIQQKGRGTRADSMNAAYTKDLMVDIVRDKGGKISPKELEELMFGKEYTLPEAVKNEFKDGFMNIEEFKAKIPSLVPADQTAKYTEIAEKMAKLQPAVKGIERITTVQAEKVFKGGYLNNPDFLKELYEVSYGKNKKTGLANFLNPYKFISAESIETADEDLKLFIKRIIEKAEKSGKDITADILEKASKTNFRTNVLNWGTGFVISALFLSTLIPKIQYWMTKRLTGSNSFPGTEQFRKQQSVQNQTEVTA